MRHIVLRLLLLPLLAAFVPSPAAPQDAPQSAQPRVYEMYFKVDYPDVPGWVDSYQTHEVPVLEALVEEGILMGFGMWIHDTGGEYNLRYNMLAPNWDALGDFVDAYYSRVDTEALQGAMAMTREHTDQIWLLGPNSGRFPAEPTLIYESAFELAFSGAEQWNADFLEYTQPALERAVEEGYLQAWAALAHDTGGPYNAKYLYWVEEWDRTDDALAFINEVRQELGMGMESSAAIRRHSDDIWRAVPRR